MMREKKWEMLARTLEEYSFTGISDPEVASPKRWFASTSVDDSVDAYLRIESQPRFRVLTVHLGWRHEPTRAFCLQALEHDWSAGFSWLSDGGWFNLPCLSTFNLGDYMEWPLVGIPVEPEWSYQVELRRLGDAIEVNNWGRTSAKRLLERYAEDRKPFQWILPNAAIRLAEIAGLSAHLRSGPATFDRCVSAHCSVIETHMFNLGSASEWISALRSRLTDSLDRVD